MDVLSSVSARSCYEYNVRKIGPGLQATLNGISQGIRLSQLAPTQPTGESTVKYAHVVDVYC